MKVDVILDQSFRDIPRASVSNGEISSEAYLTARFPIPNVYITSQARQAGQPRDLYAEPIDINERLEFVKGEKIAHGLRPVEAYALNADGTSSVDFENKIHTSSHWILSENSAGQVDISMSIDDLLKQTEGRIVLDPSIYFQEGVNGYTGCEDSFLYIYKKVHPVSEYAM